MTIRITRALAPLAALGLATSLAACTPGDEPAGPATTGAASSSDASAHDDGRDFDLQAHRGGRGEYIEESRLAFTRALELGVDTLEFDIVLTADGVPAVWHDPDIQPGKCRDTAPAAEGDPAFPYVGKDVHDLNWEQIATLRCDIPLPDFPDQKPAPDNRILRLDEVFALAAERDAEVGFNIETKIEADDPARSASPEEFVAAILDEVDRASVAERVTIQSFDWRSLPLVKQHDPGITTAALYDETTWTPDSPWITPVDHRKVDGDVLAGVRELGADIVSPGYAVPYGTSAGDDDFHPVADADYVRRAHDLGLKVLPWTVNDAATMEWFIDAGVDGLITDHPTLLRRVMADRGMPLPEGAGGE